MLGAGNDGIWLKEKKAHAAERAELALRAKTALATLGDRRRQNATAAELDPLSVVRNYHSYSTKERANATLNCAAERFELAPERILSLGCAQGYEIGALKVRFRGARITGTDMVFDLGWCATPTHPRHT